MAGGRETLEEPVEKEGSLVGDRKDPKVAVLGSDLSMEDGVCTREGAVELNDDVGFDGSEEEGKSVNHTNGEAAWVLGEEDSQVVNSLEGKSENAIAELDGNGATFKAFEEQSDIDDREVNKLPEKEASSDAIQVESDVRQSIEEQDGIPEQVGSQGEQGIEGESFHDAEGQKPSHGKVTKRASKKNSGNILQASYVLPTEKGDFSVYDMVWGKVKSHPWWPGQIYDPSDSSVEANKHLKKDRYLVAYFGDGTFAWNESSLLKPFRTHFSNIVKQSNSHAFRNAVDCALDEVTRRAEFGLACSCIPKDTYDNIKHQTIENAGIQEELSFTRRVDESLNVSSFSPENLLEYVKTLSEFPTGSFDRLEFFIAKAQLLAFYRLKGYSSLPELQYCGSVDNDTNTLIKDADKSLNEVDKHSTHVSEKDGQIGAGDLKTTNDSCLKCKLNLKDDIYPKKKKRSLSEPAGGTLDSKHGNNWSVGVNMISPASSRKRKTIDHYAGVSGMKDRRKTVSLAKVSNTIKQSFKIGERILRVANQLTGTPSMLKCSGDRYQVKDGCADGFSGSGSDAFSPKSEKTERSSLFVPTEYSSLDDLLHFLQWVAQEPRGDYSSLNVIVSFFSDFRNSIIVASDSGKEILPTNNVGTKRKKRRVGESPETFIVDDVSGTHRTDMGIQSGSEKKQSQRSSRRDYQHAPAEPEKLIIVYTRRSHSRKLCSDSNHVAVPERPSGCVDKNSPAELILNFAELDSVPQK